MALPKLIVVKSSLKSLKNNRQGVYFLQSFISPTACNLTKNSITSHAFLKEVDHRFLSRNF